MRTALVTGANRGIGKEIALQLHKAGVRVFALGRNEQALQETFKSTGIEWILADMQDPSSLQTAAHTVSSLTPQLDILINNAGIISNVNVQHMSSAELKQVLDVNVFGVIELTQLLLPLLSKSNDARIVSVSSGMGHFDELYPDHAAYRLSKYLLNGWTRQMAEDLPKNISINCICPGWCHTDMGGANAPRTPAQGADTAVWIATKEMAENGKFWRDRKEIDW